MSQVILTYHKDVRINKIKKKHKLQLMSETRKRTRDFLFA